MDASLLDPNNYYGWHVYYNDDYEDNGGVGLESFEHEQHALDFINVRIQQQKSAPSNYTLISGNIRPLEAIEVVTQVKIV